MPLWEITTNKQINDETWTNVYWVDAANIDDAEDVGQEIIAAEALVHYQQVLINSFRVSDGLPGTDVFRIVPVGGVGTVNPTGDLLALFNTMRVDFAVATGRPSRKYLRGCLTEADVQFNTININALARGQDYANALVAIEEYVDVDGQDIISGVPQFTLQMRQLRRGSKRRAPTP